MRDMLAEKGGDFIGERLKGGTLEELTLREGVLKKKDKGNSQQGRRKIGNDDANFRTEFGRLLDEVVLPWMKEEMAAKGVDSETTFYVQDSPTLRVQPGPCARSVTPYNDQQYGHQPGELNFWIPFTDVDEIKTTLWAEENEDQGDFTPLTSILGRWAYTSVPCTNTLFR